MIISSNPNFRWAEVEVVGGARGYSLYYRSSERYFPASGSPTLEQCLSAFGLTVRSRTYIWHNDFAYGRLVVPSGTTVSTAMRLARARWLSLHQDGAR